VDVYTRGYEALVASVDETQVLLQSMDAGPDAAVTSAIAAAEAGAEETSTGPTEPPPYSYAQPPLAAPVAGRPALFLLTLAPTQQAAKAMQARSSIGANELMSHYQCPLQMAAPVPVAQLPHRRASFGHALGTVPTNASGGTASVLEFSPSPQQVRSLLLFEL
jgi:hypothetical protein